MMLLFAWKLRHSKSSGYNLRLKTISQLEDFTGDLVYKIVDMTTSQDRYQLKLTNVYYLVVGKHKKKKQPSKPATPSTLIQRSLYDFLPLAETEKFRMPSHFKIQTVVKEAFMKDLVSNIEYTSYKTFKSCRGSFYFLARLNDFSLFDTYQNQESAVQRACGDYSLADLVKLRLFMYKMGFKNYEQFYRMKNYMPFLSLELDLDTIDTPAGFPHVSTLEKALNVAGSKPVINYFTQLVNESATNRLVDFKVLMLDGTFFHANCNNNTNPST